MFVAQYLCQADRSFNSPDHLAHDVASAFAIVVVHAHRADQTLIVLNFEILSTAAVSQNCTKSSDPFE